MSTLKKAEQAINEFYGDVSYTPQQTKDGLAKQAIATAQRKARGLKY